jgi:hypothetical protein
VGDRGVEVIGLEQEVAAALDDIPVHGRINRTIR